MIRVTPDFCLEIGQRVIVDKGGQHCVVVESSMVPSSNKAGPICLHQLRYPDGKVRPCNYSFIIVQCSWCDKPATKFLMHQSFCDVCAEKSRALHAKMNP